MMLSPMVLWRGQRAGSGDGRVEADPAEALGHEESAVSSHLRIR